MEPISSSALTTSAIVLAVGGALIAWARDLPRIIGRFLARHSCASVYVRDQDLVRQLGIAGLELWGVRGRWISASLKILRERSEVTFEPARGWHLVRWQGMFLLLDRGKEDSPSAPNSDGRMQGQTETLTLYAMRRHAARLREIVREGSEYGRIRLGAEGAVKILDRWGEGWVDLPASQSRSLASVVLPGAEAEDLLEKVRLFLSRASWYAERGVPWRLGIGIFGPPGSGKSTLVRALCSECKLVLHVADISSKSVGDSQLIQALARTGPKSAVLFDDFDATRLPSRDDAPGGVTLAGLFAAFDGPTAAEGRILFICSNNPERLDPALLRPGRIDISLTLAAATSDQASRLYLLWHPGDEVGAKKFGRDGEGHAMAHLQGCLLSGAFPGHGIGLPVGADHEEEAA